MTVGPDDIVGEAITWHLRRDEMDGADWHEFVLWLEASALHASTYDAIALQDDLPEPAVALEQASANDNDSRRRWVIGSGVAVAIAATVIGFIAVPGNHRYTIVTRPGEQRTVALGDGTMIEVNGATRLTLDRQNTRMAMLDNGEAIFRVHHDTSAPFIVKSGSRTIQDAGTVFNVIRDGARLEVQVAEGAVVFEPGRQALTLTPGSAVTLNEQSMTVAVSRVPVDTVGGWRHGSLSYVDMPLTVVRNALQRHYGVDLALGGNLSSRSFTGMVRVTGNAARDIPHFAALIGADWQRNGTRWSLSPKGVSAH